MSERYEIAELDGLEPIECCCGTTRRAFVEVDDAPASVHYLEVKDEPTTHYHRNTAEIYLVLEGEGYLELDGDRIPVRPLTAVLIKPGCRHRAIGNLKVINYSIPKYSAKDFFCDDDAVKEGEEPVH